MRGAICKGYQVWGKLSQGGMGDVWLARHAELALPVIIKTLHAGAHESFAAQYARLLHEARMTARLTSPRVVRVVDVGVYSESGASLEDIRSVPFLVEEYVDGIDMAEFDRRRRNALHRPLPLWAVADLVAQAAEGLHAAHQGGVIHCDVKPSNLFGLGHGHIKVGDFGVAVASAAQHGGAPAGTPLFMAPEQLLGDPLDRRADVYALGATAFTLRYGFTPYETPGEALRDGAQPRFPPAGSPEEAYFQHVVARMMARRVDARYPNLMVPRHYMRALGAAATPRVATARLSPQSFQIGPARVSFEVGDLSLVEADALVNSAHSDMRMRSSLGDALRSRGGDAIEAEAMAGGERALGDCVATGAGSLRARGVLHAVGGWNEVSCVARATHRALLMAEELGYQTVAVPAIATGSSGVSVENCADAMVGALRQHLTLGGSRLQEVRFVLYDAPTFARFTEVAAGLILGSDDALRAVEPEGDAPATPHEASHAPTLYAATPGASAPPPPVRTPTERVTDDGERG